MSLENICIYLRKSRSDREAEARGEGETLARHEKTLLELAKRRGYHIGAIYKEVVSGETISARPVMQQLLREVEAGMWDGVLVMEVERLARGDTIDQGTVSRAFQFSDTKIITPLKVYDPNNEFDEEYFEFGLFMSRREYKTIKRRLNAGRLASVKEGKYCGNRPPYGYERVKIKGEKGFTLTPVPDQVEVVRLIFNWYVNGDSGERLGVAKITRKLNNMGIPALTRKDWSPATISGILQNPVYCGKLRWDARKTVRKIENGQVIVSRPRSYDNCILVKGLHPAIISEELFQAAQKIRSKNPPRPVGVASTVKNPLSGLIYCKKCGRAMVRRPYAKNGYDDTLMCAYTSCSTVSSKLYLVEQAVINGLAELVQNYKLNDTLTDHSGTDIIQAKELLISDKRTYLSKLQEQKNKQYDFLEQGIYTTEIFLERSAATAEEIRNCEAAIDQLETELAHDQKLLAQKNNFIPRCEYLLSNYWDWDVKTRNDVLKELIEKVEYSKDTKNHFMKGNEITFSLDIFPKIQ